MPVKQTLADQRPGVVFRGVEQHFDHPIDPPARRYQPANVHPQAPCNGGADLFRVQCFALDLARLDHILGQGAQMRFLSKVEPQRLHPALQPALLQAGQRERLR